MGNDNTNHMIFDDDDENLMKFIGLAPCDLLVKWSYASVPESVIVHVNDEQFKMLILI